MRYGIIADIHSNLEALEKVLSALEGENVDEILCLGDIVGYGADPSECIRLVREKCAAAVCGNHDYAAVNADIREYFNPDALEALLWTEDRLNKEEKSYLAGLDIQKSAGDFLMVHSSPLFPKEWSYIYTAVDARKHFPGFDEGACFVGHTHIPAVFFCSEKNGSCGFSPEERVFLPPGMRHIINPGSVGQPRDGNPGASFAVYDEAAREVEIIRVPYDAGSASKKILEAGLPDKFALRLEGGE